ncbi:SDR family oxidoreductase [Nocardioides sp. Leaf285]|uniref:SDR family oxidoreductase n=1 Tax=Nocardioides sp. Leaf285 TaxID=1736322 RepID=UPI00070307DC|nr:SDR family oxidoreductase [Nocardioides sp. Leaf285]KQP65598.1 short-chain dehydrogenase [Nocardioides sp. Leaf285]
MTSPTVLITGAAAGIGRATALRFAREGWTVGAYDIDEAGLATLASEVEALRTGARVVSGTLDVRDAEAYAARAAELVAETGRLDVLVNNAGILLAGQFAEIDVAAHHREIDVNVKGVVNGLHAGFEPLRATAAAHGSAHVVNLASASAIYGQAELANYSATKFFLRGITEALDLEWGRHGVRVVAMWPLFVQTAMTQGVHTGTTDSLGVNLGADDVATAIWDAVHPTRARRVVHQVHFPVGTQTKAMALGARFSPAWLTRRVNKRFAGV